MENRLGEVERGEETSVFKATLDETGEIVGESLFFSPRQVRRIVTTARVNWLAVAAGIEDVRFEREEL
jgi:hypothetical protein